MRAVTNVVVIVLDCVRAQDFPGGRTALPGMPAVERLLREGVTFPKTVASSSWTLPSHATILTGLNPWESNTHSKGRLRLAADIPTIATYLTARGYRTLLLSGNSLLDGTTGLSQGFQACLTADWWEPFLRNTPSNDLPRDWSRESGAQSPGRFNGLQTFAVSLLSRNPATVDVANRIMIRVRGRGESPYPVAKWIEPTFANWLASLPPDQPFFSLINLIDAHNPYLTTEGGYSGFLDWYKDVRVSQHLTTYIAESHRGNGWSQQVLTRLYRESVKRLDERVGNILRVLEDAGRMSNTLFILTSDHGQALLEKGHLFHGFRVDDELLRVPLILRFGDDSLAGERAKGWASLADIFPTIGALTNLPSVGGQSGVDLRSLVDRERGGYVDAVADGLVNPGRASRWIDKSALLGLDRVRVAVYRGSSKVVLEEGTGLVRSFDEVADPEEQIDTWGTEHESLQGHLAEARRVMNAMIPPDRQPQEEGVSERLRRWGYE